MLKVRGYWVQVYVGNNLWVVCNEVNNVVVKVKEEFFDMFVYVYFQFFCWLCCVGDFCSIEEVDVVMCCLKVIGVFKEVFIVCE